MKIKKEHYTLLEEEINRVIKDNNGGSPGGIYQIYKDNGLSDKRYRWDLFRASTVRIYDKNTKPDIMHKYCLPLYDYLNDTHIDSALKSITGKRG